MVNHFLPVAKRQENIKDVEIMTYCGGRREEIKFVQFLHPVPSFSSA
jgi:hypothetical protein